MRKDNLEGATAMLEKNKEGWMPKEVSGRRESSTMSSAT